MGKYNTLSTNNIVEIKQHKENKTKKISILGIDLAKNVFHAVGMNKHGKILLKKKLSRAKLIEFIAQLQPITIAMEACGGSHYWAREFAKYGHEVKLIAPQFVKPYVKTNKNDIADAEAICEAATRETMRFVGIKSIEQQDIQSMHTARERFVKSKTAIVNEIRGLLQEYGIIMPKGINNFKRLYYIILEENKDKISHRLMEILELLYDEFRRVEEKTMLFDEKLKKLSKDHPECKRLLSVPGIGPITSTAIVFKCPDPSVFKNGREFAAWLGLVPSQHSSGGKSKLGGISKRGDVYLRKLLVHGARSVLRCTKSKTDRTSVWVERLKKRKAYNVTAVAMANKNARVIWSLLKKQQQYRTFEAVKCAV